MKRKRNSSKSEKDLIKKRKVFTEVFIVLDFIPTHNVHVESGKRKRKRKNISNSEFEYVNHRTKKEKPIKKRKETCPSYMMNDGMVQLTEYKRINQYKYARKKLVQEIEEDVNDIFVLRVYSNVNSFLRTLNHKRSRRGRGGSGSGNYDMDLDE